MMKNRIFCFLLLLAAALSVDAQRLTILHTSDTHSCVEPVSPNDADINMADKGGFVRRATLIDSLRRTEPDLLLFDCGDYSQGSVYYNMYKGEVEVKLMNAMGYDVVTIGNHEFDYGLDNMARLFRMAQFAVVCCNYNFTGTPCVGLVKPYVVLERKGLRIGVLGVAPRMEGLVVKSNYGDTGYTLPSEAAQPVVDRLRNEEHCDVVICLSHLGYTLKPESDVEFIARTRGIDLVLGGHSHTNFTNAQYFPNADGRLIPLDHQGKNARFVGLLQLEY
ncbi:MAG: metallophosphoesterase [Bacteroidaceae bacterium]|nr:metallophosphoesterase [Bacteroidaceae bacterium]